MISSISNTAHADVPAAIVLVGDIPADGAVDAARQEMPAAWRVTRLAPSPAPGSAHPLDDESQSVARAYFDADFLRCLTKLQSSSLDVDRLLEKDRRDDAARVGVLAAACALGAGDKPRARELVHRLLVRGLESADTLRQTTPEFQALVDDERAVVRKLPSVTIEVQTSPDRASVHVDGLLRCRNSPCRVHAIRGEHIVTAELLGRRPRAVDRRAQRGPAAHARARRRAGRGRARPAARVAGGGHVRRPTSRCRRPRRMHSARATSFWCGPSRTTSTRPRTIASATRSRRTSPSMPARTRLPAAVRAAVHEERGVSGPKPIVKQPFFWLTVAGVALLTGTIVLLANRPVEVQHELVFH